MFQICLLILDGIATWNEWLLALHCESLPHQIRRKTLWLCHDIYTTHHGPALDNLRFAWSVPRQLFDFAPTIYRQSIILTQIDELSHDVIDNTVKVLPVNISHYEFHMCLPEWNYCVLPQVHLVRGFWDIRSFDEAYYFLILCGESTIGHQITSLTFYCQIEHSMSNDVLWSAIRSVNCYSSTIVETLHSCS